MFSISGKMEKKKEKKMEFGVHKTHMSLEHTCVTWHMDWLSRTRCLFSWIT